MSEFSPGFSDARQPTAEVEDERENISRIVLRYWMLLKRYFWIPVLTCALAVVVSYFYTQRLPRVYQAQSEIIFRSGQANVFGKQIEQVDLLDPGGRWQFEQFWNTQKEVMNSRWFSEQLVKREGLLDVEGFVPNQDKMSEEEATTAAGAKVRGMVEISLKPNSRVAVVQARATDPKLAQRVANAYADSYVKYTGDYQSGGLKKIVTWFDTYVSQKRDELGASKAELHQFKRDNRILSISFEDRRNLTAVNMESVNSDLNGVRSKLVAEEAMHNQLQQMKREDVDLRTIANLVDSEPLRTAIGREAELKQKIAQLETVYGPEHEEMRKVTQQLLVVQASMEEEIQRIMQGVENRVAVLRRNETALMTKLEELKDEAHKLDELGLQYNQIKDRSESLEQLYDTVLKRSEELDINSLWDANNIEVLEEADEPKAPISPNLPFNLLIGFGLGLGLGFGVIVLIETLDNTVKSQSDVERYTRKPILGHLPKVEPSLLKQMGTIDTMTAIAPKSSFAEGIKTLRTNLMFMAPDNPPKLLLVTSPGPGEGKTLITINMAIAMAQSGLKTLIVDTDMRRPRVHKALGIENGTGISAAIVGKAKALDLVRETDVENLHVLSCGDIPPNPSELLHTDLFHQVVDELAAGYDRVIFDSPPLAAVSDALILSHSVDATLLILKFGQTRRELLKRSIDQLEAIGAPFMGCVLNDITADASSAYGYSYYYYRYRYDSDDGPDGPQQMAS